MLYSLIIPIYNENRTLKTLLKDLNALTNQIEIILIDDGSTDGGELLLNNSKGFKLITNKINLGKGSSIIKGLKIAKGENIILADGDFEVKINDVHKLINTFENGNKNGAVVGKRWDALYKKNFKVIDLGNYIINSLFNLIYGSRMNDILCCFKLVPKKLLKKINLKSKRFSIETEIMSKLVLNQVYISEVKINYNRRTKKEGKKIKYSDIFDIILTMIRTRFIVKIK
jgi:glycosyltransferase involved in cell wall biosynthesis